MSTEENEIISGLSRLGVIGSAILTRDGMILDSDLPLDIHEETFAIMCATMVGASITANSEIDYSSPDKIIVDSSEGKIVLATISQNKILATVIDQKFNLGKLFEHLKILKD